MDNEREVRLGRQIEDLVRSRLGVLEQDISRLQREVNESFTKLLERTDAASAMPESDDLLAQIEAEVNARVDHATAESVRLGADIALLRDSVTELDAQRTQAEVLNALVARIANFSPRVVLFVVKGSNALAWAARGFDEQAGNTPVRGLSISLQADTALRATLNAQQTFYGSSDQQSDNQAVFGRLGNTHPQRILTVPLKVRGKSAAIIYADSSDHGEAAINVEAIELLVHTAGLVVELVSLRSRMTEGARAAPKQAAATPAAPQSEPTPQPEQAPQPEPEPEPAMAESVEPDRTTGPITPPSGSLPPTESGDSGQSQSEAPPPVEGHPSPPPTYSTPAAEPAHLPDPQPVANSSQTAGWSTEPVEDPANLNQPQPESVEVPTVPTSRRAALDEEEKQHNDARRFARLLVSEIKLYNENKVAEGRRNNDLYDRLKEDIDRSRQMYEKRVTPVVAAKFDYFYDELVNTLAEGDPAKLGSDYPGPTVRI